MTYSDDLRLKALQLCAKNHSIKITCELLNIDRKTLYNWKNTYKNIKIIDTSNKQILNELNNNTIQNYERTKYKTKIQQKHNKFIVKFVINNPYFNCKQLLFELNKKYKIYVCKKTIYNYLSRLGITYKKARHKIIPNIDNLLDNKIIMNNKIEQLTKDSEIIISIDESSYKLNMMIGYGWSLKGNKTNFVIDNNQTQTYSVLCAIDKNKIIGYIIVPGSINADIFIEFLSKIIPAKKKCTLLLDNARIHKSKKFYKYIETTNINLLYNITYNPESNPIEHVFNKSKQIVRQEPTNNENLLINAIDKGFNSITKTDLRNFYKASFDTLTNEKIHDDKIKENKNISDNKLTKKNKVNSNTNIKENKKISNNKLIKNNKNDEKVSVNKITEKSKEKTNKNKDVSDNKLTEKNNKNANTKKKENKGVSDNKITEKNNKIIVKNNKKTTIKIKENKEVIDNKITKNNKKTNTKIKENKKVSNNKISDGKINNTQNKESTIKNITCKISNLIKSKKPKKPKKLINLDNASIIKSINAIKKIVKNCNT